MAEIYIGNTQISSGGEGGAVDTSNFYTKSEIDSSIENIFFEKLTNASGYSCYVPRYLSDSDKNSIKANNIDANSATSIVFTKSTWGSKSGQNSVRISDDGVNSGKFSFSQGEKAKASGDYSHAEGFQTTASGTHSHAEGYLTTASNNYSHAEGDHTQTSALYQHVEGRYNTNESNAIKIIGNGTGDSTRHNALEVHLSGEVKISDTHASGEVYQKPMFVIQDKLHQIDTSIAALEANSGGGTADLSNYYTKSEVDDMIPTVPTALSSFTNDTGYVTNNDTSVYALKSEVPTVPTALSSFTNDTGYVTDNDISTFVTASTVYDKNYIDTSLNSIESRLNSSSQQQVSFQVLTQAQYAALTPNSNTIYFITN